MRMSPSCACCETPPPECNCCTGETPLYVSVTISGIANGDTCCDELNGVYILDHIDGCIWRYEGSICNGDYDVRIDFSFSDVTCTMVVYLRVIDTADDSVIFAVLTNDSGDATDCCDLSIPDATLIGITEDGMDCDTSSLNIAVNMLCDEGIADADGYSSAAAISAALSDGVASASSSSTSSGVGAMLVESVADADADSTAPGVGAALFDGVAAADGHATAEAVSPSPECCGCNWLEDYWLDNKRLRLTFSGAITGYIILDAEPELVGDACSQWSGSDDSNIDDADCFLLPMTAQVTCEPGLSPTVAMEILLTHGSTNCNIIIEAEPDSYDCGPGLEVIWTATIEEALPTCDCDVQTITLTLTNEDTP